MSSSDCSPASLEKQSTLATQAALPEHFEVHYDVEPWEDLALPKNHELVENLRHLTFRHIVDISALMKGVFPPFKQLGHLEFIRTRIYLSLSGTNRFSSFQFTLEHISFTTCSISKRSLARLINYFLNLKSLTIYDLSSNYPHKEKVLRTPQISRTLEKLAINVAASVGSDPKLLKALWKKGLRFNELDLQFFEQTTNCAWASFVVHLFGASAKCLRLPFFLDGRPNPLNSMKVHRDNLLLDLEFRDLELWRCLELCEFELETSMDLRNEDLERISAIKSKKIEKIIFRRCGLKTIQEFPWAELDKILTNLAGQLEGDKKLEVQFRYGRGAFEPSDREISLPEFVKKGRVTIWDLEGKPVRCSGAGKSPGGEL